MENSERRMIGRYLSRNAALRLFMTVCLAGYWFFMLLSMLDSGFVGGMISVSQDMGLAFTQSLSAGRFGYYGPMDMDVFTSDLP